ncbi:MAG TPA: ABC transporter ATP-binding protein [Gemmatimonadaceae bacterium]|jgi:ABC-2 type transport system ATP-binding protein|nr:ABC transporter ATP-binding protein [Gemmatimonadaceae bacterium]
MTDAPAIEITRLVKKFGDAVALDGIELAVPRGSVFGFLGPNGAGKTTALRILTGLARPTSGEARILGADVSTAGNDVRSQIGYLPDVPGFYPWMTAVELVEYAGRLFGIGPATVRERAESLLEMAGLSDVRTKVGGFSRGMKQRLGIAQALINAPSVLLLDEPTSALDPIGRREVLEMIASLRGRTTVFFSTHILADVERVCDTVAILDRGRVVANAPIAELKRRAAVDRLVIEVDGDVAMLISNLEGRPWLRSIERGEGVITLAVSDLKLAQRELPAAIAATGLGLKRLEGAEVSLEDMFVALVRRAEQ